jgi:hypothetical protein
MKQAWAGMNASAVGGFGETLSEEEEIVPAAAFLLR